MKKQIPNLITLVNLFLGCCAVASILYGQFGQAFFFFLASGLADYLDGTFARVLKAGSEIGKQLDSLADMVSFGFVPGAIIYMLLVKGLSEEDVLPIELTLAASPAFVVTLFAAIRLANFNLDTRQTEHFIGMPTPSVAMYTVGLMMIYQHNAFGLSGLVTHPVFLYATIPILSWLMVARFNMFSLKIKSFGWAGNEIQIIFALTAIVMIFLLKAASFSCIIIAYTFFSMIHNLREKD